MHNESSKPSVLDFAIIGAPKTGTTSLFEALSMHPEIHASTPKETYFFMDDCHPLPAQEEGHQKHTIHTSGLSAFQSFFDESPNGLRLEATTHHFYQRTARKTFSEMEKKPHVFFILRQPAYRVRSSFVFTKHKLGLIDSKLTFDKYVNILLSGELADLGQFYHSHSSLYIAVRELKLNKYVVWLKWWEDALGTKRVHPLVFEDIIEADQMVLRRICQILRIDPSFYENRSMPSENETFLARSPALQRLAREVGSQIPEGWLKSAIRSVYQTLQFQDPSSAKPSDTKRGVENLKEYFRPWNERLAEYSELILSSWA